MISLISTAALPCREPLVPMAPHSLIDLLKVREPMIILIVSETRSDNAPLTFVQAPEPRFQEML